MNTLRIPVIILAVIVVALGAWLVLARPHGAAPAAGSASTTTAAGLANPASVNCVQNLHAQLEIADEAGGQVGYCHLPDGRVCEEWSLMRGGCTPPQSGSGTPPSDPSAVSGTMQGTWQSTDDPNYTVTIGQDGKWVDSYKGATAADNVSQTGTYTMFTSANPDPDFTGTIVPHVVYIKLVEGTATYYYSVLESSGTNLQLSYLDRGNTLSFVKVQ